MPLPILIVDDSLLARKVLAKALPEDWDVKITFASNGREALDAYRKGLASVMFLDLTMPDMNGYVIGDTVLREMAARVAATVRSQDVFGRFGGEEFGLLLPCTKLDDALLVAEKMRETIGGQPIHAKGVEVAVTASLGAAFARAETHSYEILLNEADAALYSAKRQGRDRSVAFGPPVMA
jgi:diguanylate cyclase (GGDEF)-like protein